MKIHIIQHVSFESPGLILEWAKEKNAQISYTRVFDGVPFPPHPGFDLLVVMGGPMGANDENILPWMAEEKQLIRKAIDGKVKILGICLGAQLLASVLGSKVYPNSDKEIGWWPITTVSRTKRLLPIDWPENWTSFHWHGDTFDLPAGAELLFSSKPCANQGYFYNEHVLALQFHMEATPSLVSSMTKHCGDELIDGSYIQTAADINNTNDFYMINRQLFFSLLDHFIDSKIS